MKTILSIIAIAGSVVLFVWVASIGLNKQEATECLKWQAEAVEYPLWYSTAWQREQCEVHGLPLLK